MRAALAGAAFAVLVALVAWGWRAPSGPVMARAVCDGVATDVDSVVRGELLLHRGLLPGGEADAATVQEAVALQLRFAFAALHNEEGRAVWTPDGPPRGLEVLGREEVAYGRDVALDWPEDPELRPESRYVREALARGRLAATDPALAIRWQARVRVAHCDPDGRAAEDVRLPAPRDPYLLYWAIDAAKRVPHVYRDKRVVGFPCADPKIADYAHPEYLWYYWLPRREGCAARLRGDVGDVTVEVRRRRAPDGELGRWRDALAADVAARPLRVRAVFGYLNHQEARPEHEVVRAALAQDGALDLEWGSAEYVRFVRGTGDVLAERSLVTAVAETGPVAEITGVLRRSGRPVEIVAHLTETDLLAPAAYAPRHTPLLLAGLREADAIVYAGHSGLGVNFSRGQLEQGGVDVAGVLAGSPTRLIAFIGCYTYAYFGDDLAGALRHAPLFAYTGNSVAAVGDSALHVLRTVDCLLAGDGAAGTCEVPAPGPADARDFVIYELAR